MIITIGRQFGSRGRAVGKALASAYHKDYFWVQIIVIESSSLNLYPRRMKNAPAIYHSAIR